MTPVLTRNLILDYVDALQRGDGDEVAACFAPDATWDVPGDLPISGRHAGRDAILGGLVGAVMARLDPASLRFDVTSLTTEADRGVLEYTIRARTRHGRAYENAYLAIFEVRGGLIAAVREYLDTQRAARVLFAT
jgi:hypothetical protein